MKCHFTQDFTEEDQQEQQEFTKQITDVHVTIKLVLQYKHDLLIIFLFSFFFIFFREKECLNLNKLGKEKKWW